MSNAEHPDSEPQSVHEALQRLRTRAEARRHLVTQSTADKSPEEVQRLVQELQVHQIELEMQYEELLLAQGQAEALRAQYVDLYEFAPAGYFTLDAHGLIRQLNLSGARLLGTVRQHLAGRRFALFVAPAARGEFIEFLARVLAAEHRQTCELPMLHQDGTPFFAQLEGLAVPATPDQPAQCRVALIDTTASHETRRALEASEARFRQLFEQNSDACLLVQRNVVVDCNAAALRLLGTTDKGRLLGQHPWDLATPQHPAGVSSAEHYSQGIAAALRLGSHRGEFMIRHHVTGELRWIEGVATPIAVDGQSLLYLIWRDITAAKQSVEKLRASEASLNLALTASATGTFTWDFATSQVQWDERAQTTFGYPYQPGPVPLEALVSRLHPDDAAYVRGATQAAISQQAPLALSCRVVWPDGSVHYVSSAGRVVKGEDGQPRSFAGIITDVTARHEAEEDLRYQRLLVERVFATMPAVLSRLQPDGRYLEVLGQGLCRLNLTPDELVDQSALDLFPANRESLEQLLAGERVEFDSFLDLNGQRFYFHNYGFFDEQRQQALMLVMDVTEMEEQKRRLQAGKEFSDSLLDNSVDGIMAFDQQLRFLAWNRVLERQTGRFEADLLGRGVFEAFPEWETKSPGPAIRQVLRGKRLTRYNMSFHGQPGHYEAYLVPLLGSDNEVNGGLVLIRDVTERVQLAEEATRLKLRQQQEVMSAILTTQEQERKRISEALHNGVGQLLYATKLNLEKIAGATGKERATAVSLLNDAIRATRTISFELTPGILEDFGLKIALEELIKRLPQESLRIQLNLTGLELPRPQPVEIALYRVIQELLNNIIRHARASEAFIHVVHEGAQIHVSVEDNGVGMSLDPNGGTQLNGIGLTAIRSRIELLGGELNVQSRVGSGTIITIELKVP